MNATITEEIYSILKTINLNILSKMFAQNLTHKKYSSYLHLCASGIKRVQFIIYSY